MVGTYLSIVYKSFVCSTSKCQVIEGFVEMKIKYALDNNQISHKSMLNYQAASTIEKVVVDCNV